MENRLSEGHVATECDRHDEDVPYTCGGCQRTYQTISLLHEHLIDHIEGGSYHYDNNSKTAFPKYDSKCEETQTEVTPVRENLDPCDLCNVETQTVDSNELKCAETQTFETCFAFEQSKSIAAINGLSNNCLELPLVEGYYNDQQFQSVAIKREIVDTFTNSESDSLEFDQNCDHVNMSINEVLTIKQEQSDPEYSKETCSTDLNWKTEADPEWKPMTAVLKRGRPRKSNPQNTFKMTSSTAKLKHAETKISLKNFLKSTQKSMPTKDDLKTLTSDTDDNNIDGDKKLKNDKTSKKQLTGAEKRQLKIRKTCSKCNTIFSTLKLFRHHMSEVHGEQPWLCFKCGKQFKSLSNLSTHRAKEHYNKRPTVFRCDFCDFVSDDQQSLKQHKLELHSSEMKCGICDKTFLHQVNLKKHRIQHHFTEFSEYKCLECRKQFLMKCDYKHHMDTWHADKPEIIICETCGFQAANKKSLKNHKKIHTDRERKYSCTECPFKAYTRNSFRQHISIHTGRRDHMCNVCGKSYRNSYALTSHMRQHTGEKPYKCDRCPKTFAGHASYGRHKKMHNDDKRHSCPYCDKTFVQKTNCKAHMRQHTGEKPYICDLCGAGFTHNVSRKNHIMKAHP